MAFNFRGLDEVRLSLQEVAKLPDSVKDDMLNAGADALIPVQRAKAREMGVHRTGELIRSIGKTKPKTDKHGTRLIQVYAQGSRKRGRKSTTNAQIHFVNEFGTKKQKARPFTKAANEAAKEDVAAAELAVYDQWLKDHDL